MAGAVLVIAEEGKLFAFFVQTELGHFVGAFAFDCLFRNLLQKRILVGFVLIKDQ